MSHPRQTAEVRKGIHNQNSSTKHGAGVGPALLPYVTSEEDYGTDEGWTLGMPSRTPAPELAQLGCDDTAGRAPSTCRLTRHDTPMLTQTCCLCSSVTAGILAACLPTTPLALHVRNQGTPASPSRRSLAFYRAVVQ